MSFKTQKISLLYIFFSICILADVIILITFLIIELQNNQSLKEVFQVIVNFYDVQSFFYLTTLSLFALVCNADEIGQTTCESQFIDFSEESIIKYGFQENQMIYDYITN